MKTKTVLRNAISIIALIGAVIHMADAVLGIFPVMQLRPLFLMFVMVLALLIEISKGKRTIFQVWHVILLIASIVSTGFLIINFERISRMVGYIMPEVVVMGCVLIVALIYVTGKVLGKVLPVVIVVFLFYALFGQHLPQPIGHSGLQFNRMITFLYTTGNGIFGVSIGVCSRILVLFIIFAEFLKKCGADKLFFAVAFAVTKRARGGAAKSSVVASSLFGTIAGSPIANVMVTGTFTIPMMKKVGYPGYLAAGIEAASSSGGLIMPPIMGAGAFIMADMLGIPYVKIMAAAIIPALMYYTSLFVAVDMYSAKHADRIKKNSIDSDDADTPSAAKDYLHSIIPLVIFLILIFMGYSLSRSVVIAIISTPIISWFRRDTRMTVKDILDALSDGFRKTISLGAATASAGIIVGIIALSGLGFSFIALLSIFSEYPFIAMLITAFLCLIVGMGMPAVAAYIIVATLAVPFFVKIGFSPLAVHFFVFFFSSFATITPPVALGTYAAASLAESNVWKSSLHGFLLASVGFLIPFMFIYSNQLLGQVEQMRELIFVLPTALLGVLLYVSGIQGYLYYVGSIRNKAFRVLLIVSGMLLISPKLSVNLFVLTTLVVLILIHKLTPWGRRTTKQQETNRL